MKAAAPLIKDSLSNVRYGTAVALTGPIVPGDVNTLRIHLRR
jgi:predicted short-subunit dehydrogenase-like oxidoreductase (DUF2520 family)